MVVGGEEEAAGLRGPRNARASPRPVPPPSRATVRASAPAAVRAGPTPGCVVVEVGRKARPAVLVHRQQPAVAPAVRAQEIRGARRGISRSARSSARAAAARPAIARPFQAVEDLLVAAGPDPPVARREQLRARRIERRHSLRSSSDRLPRATSPAARTRAGASCPSKLAVAVEPEAPREHRVFALRRAGRGPRPASRRRTCPRGLRNRRRASSRSRPRRAPGRGASSRRSRAATRRNSGSPVATAACALRREQLAVVVQHLLEVRDHPVRHRPSSGRSRRRAGRRARPRPCASSVSVAMYSACRSGWSSSAVARQSRSRNSRFIGCGNLGAPPKPPNRRRSRVAARRAPLASGAGDERGGPVGRRGQHLAEHLDQRVALACGCRRRARDSTAATRASTSRKPACRISRPAGNRCRRRTVADRRGDRNMVSGQPPPRCVSIWCAIW